MLFARLIESQRAAIVTQSMREGAAVSAVAHALLIGGYMALSTDIERARPEPDAAFSPVQYLVPKDRLPALRPQRETVTWTTLATGSGEGFDAGAQPARRDEPRLEMEVPAGKKEEIEVASRDELSQPPIPLGDSIMTELQVDSAVVRYENSAAPAYPESMLRRRIEGAVIVQYVVDTLGHADTLTFRVISATHLEFARAVKSTLPSMRFRPAMFANRLVPQLVQQPFAFKIQDTTTARAMRPPGTAAEAKPRG